MSYNILFLRRIGPYHHARFKAAAKAMDLHVVETRPASQEYPWDFKPGEGYGHSMLGVASDPEKGFRGKVLRQKVKEIFDQVKPTVVVTVGWADPEYHAVFLEAEKRNIPRVIVSDSTLDDVKRYAPLEWLKRQIVKQFGASLVAGTRSSEYLQYLGMKRERIFAPWDVVDNDYFRCAAEKARGNKQFLQDNGLESGYFLCVSRFIPEKNLPFLIAAYKKYFAIKKDDAIPLVVLGSGPLFDEVQGLIESNQLIDKVLLKGFVQIQDLPQYYAHASFLILPSQSETWGLVVNEALASGVPVMVSRQCGCSDDLVVENKTGFSFAKDNILELEGLLLKAHGMEEKYYQEMKVNCVRHIEKYSLEHFAQGLKKACESANASKPVRIGPLNKLFSTMMIRR